MIQVRAHASMAVATALVLAACGGDEAAGPCAGPEPAETCGQSCSDSNPCPSGFHCGPDGECTADCAPVTSEGCRSGERCTAQGRCTAADSDGSASADARAPDAGGANGDGDGGVCASVEVGAQRVTPKVTLIVDQSGSMTTDFSDGDSRWEVLRRTLVGQPDQPGGFVHEMESIVKFGLALYSAENGGDSEEPAHGMCPRMTTVDPSLNNYGPIETEYRDADPIEDTPTGDAISFVLDQYLSRTDPGPDPVVFILATDGEPDRCEQGDPQPTPESRQEVIDAIQRAYTNGIQTFYLDVGNGVSDDHKQAAANAGIGVDPDLDADDPQAAEFWTVEDNDVGGLQDALREIIGGQLSCEIELEGEITDLDQACNGTVKLNGEVLPCGDADGWRAVDKSHIELQGEACMRLKNNPTVGVTASFPCDDVIII